MTIRCACGDVIKYPLAEMEITVGGRQIRVEAGASDTLPTSVLLGVDVPEIQNLLRECCADGLVHDEQVEKAWVVETRAQARLREQKAAIEKVKEMTSTAKPTPVVMSSTDSGVEGGDPRSGETECVVVRDGNTGLEEYHFDEEVFQGGRERQCQTRRQKRQDR